MPVSAAVTGIGTAAVKTTADFDAAMSKVAAVSGAAGESFDALRDKAREMGQHVITRAIGIWPLVEGDIYEVDEDFKYLMLCSDGLHNYVEADKIIEVLNNSELTGRQKCETLVNMANEAGGYDNITVVLAEK